MMNQPLALAERYKQVLWSISLHSGQKETKDSRKLRLKNSSTDSSQGALLSVLQIVL